MFIASGGLAGSHENAISEFSVPVFVPCVVAFNESRLGPSQEIAAAGQGMAGGFHSFAWFHPGTVEPHHRIQLFHGG